MTVPAGVVSLVEAVFTSTGGGAAGVAVCVGAVMCGFGSAGGAGAGSVMYSAAADGPAENGVPEHDFICNFRYVDRMDWRAGASDDGAWKIARYSFSPTNPPKR